MGFRDINEDNVVKVAPRAKKKATFVAPEG
jgi:hypothetical protein